MKTLIIEDEKAALRNLKAVMQEVDTDFEIVGEVDSIFDGVEWFRTHPMPELVFMDIHLADGSAFDICAQVDITCPIIFTTAYDEYALRAFKVNSVAYLLKPISRTDLQEAMHKLELLGGQPKAEKQPVGDYPEPEKGGKLQDPFSGAGEGRQVSAGIGRFHPVFLYFQRAGQGCRRRREGICVLAVARRAGRTAQSARFFPGQPPVHRVAEGRIRHQPVVQRTIGHQPESAGARENHH